MEQSTLAEILLVEEEIRAELDEEQKKANEWLAATRREIEQARQSDLARLAETIAEREQAATQAVPERAAAIVERAVAAARAMEHYEDRDLTRILREHVAVIAPGSSRDR